MTEQEYTDVIIKHREEPAPILPFAPCVERLIDNAYCMNLSKLLASEGTHWERQKAVPTLGPMLPNAPGLYMFVWQPYLWFQTGPEQSVNFPWVLYVGKAGGPEGNGVIRNRYQNEYCKFVGGDASQLWKTQEPTKREERLARYLTLRPLEFWWLTIDNIYEIERLERKLISSLRPPLNDHYGVKLRAGKPVPVI